MHVSQAYDEDIAKSSSTFWKCSPPYSFTDCKLGKGDCEVLGKGYDETENR
jgi:hypothetical protein